MKLRSFLKLILVLSIIFFFASCGSEESVDVELNATTYNLMVPVDGADENVSITSNHDWKASSNCDWVTLTITSGGEGTSNIRIIVKANPSIQERTARITITAGNVTRGINIVQKSQAGLDMPTTYYQASYEGNIVVTHSSDGNNYELKNGDEQWIKVESFGNTYRITVEPNGGATDRYGIIHFKKKDTTDWQDLLIAQVSGKEKSGFLSLNNLTINGIPFTVDDSAKCYYIPVDMDAAIPSSSKVEFDGLGVEYLIINGKQIKSGDEAPITLTPGTSMQLEMGNKLVPNRKIRTMYVTGLPIVEITAPSGIVDEPKRDCEIVLTDPKARTEGSVIRYASRGGIEIRGAGAQRYDKKSYSFKLQDKTTGEDVEAKLLGLRSDQSWILDAMWLDCAKMRNRVCFDLWNDFHSVYYLDKEPKAISGTHGYPVEMFLDGQYHGLYILSDKVDRKQLKLKKTGGYLYKANDWTNETKMQSIGGTYSNSSLTWRGYETSYPDEIGSIEFKYLYDLVQYFATATVPDFESTFESHIDINSLIDYFIFINLICAYDNTARNVLWAVYDVNASTIPKFQILPWDLDGTLGRTWDSRKIDPERASGFDNGLTLRENSSAKYFKPFQRIMNDNPKKIKTLIYNRLLAAKDGALSPDNMAKKVDYYNREIVKSGALNRDYQKWNGKTAYGYADPTVEADYMKTWYETRLTYLLNYFKSF